MTEIALEMSDEELVKKYTPVIEKIMADSLRFFRFGQGVRWKFDFLENLAYRAHYNYNEDGVHVNIYSVHFANERNEPLSIEFWLLHELRHRFQRFIVRAGDRGGDVGADIEEAKIWKNEWADYKKPVSRDEKSLAEYSKQSVEFDANVYAYAVMQYKYGDIPYLKDCIPKCYGKGFYKKADEWCQWFREMGI